MKILIYSHDTFGLGHLRRCRTIAQSLVEAHRDVSVLILTGSPIVGRFEFSPQIDFVRIPGVIKLPSGDYASQGLNLELQHTLNIRESIILHTARAFQPDLFIADKEPLGLMGELKPLLEYLAGRSTRVVLGLRDVLDAPELLRAEWKKKQALPALETFYDELWVYGSAAMGDPLQGLEISQAVRDKLLYTGYLSRTNPASKRTHGPYPCAHPYLLVTAGGGGDGLGMVDWVLRAYETTRKLPAHGLFVLGPFMGRDDQTALKARVDRLPHASVITFANNMESLVDQAEAVVGMGGYNTFCEALSFNKKTLIVPRTKPRKEQLIRAVRAARLGLVNLVKPCYQAQTRRMVEALQRLPDQPLPSKVMPSNFFDGLKTINQRVERLCRVTTLH